MGHDGHAVVDVNCDKQLAAAQGYGRLVAHGTGAGALAGRDSEAQAAMARLREIAPAMRVSTVKEWQPFRRPDDLARLEDGLRKAGLPE